MLNPRDTFCSRCGAAFPPPLQYPRTCPRCGAQVWANPIPVAVVLQPVASEGRLGLLVVRRAIPPQVGRLALPGGFVEEHEAWAVGAARELREEAGVSIEPASLAPSWFTSTEPRPDRVLLFAAGVPLDRGALGPWAPGAETSARGLVFGPGGLDDVFAFPLHAEAARRWFSAQRLTGPHAFTEA
ncbi:MAG TPA: NUDIX domain-containing protein [Kofleriaceae bacterium]|nr:NUDIX domain-containing protein [Kofleriaceae bacterium]